MELLPFAKRDDTLRAPAIGEVNSQWYQSQAALLRSSHEAEHLVFVEQQFTHPLRRMIPDRGLSVFLDLAADEPQLPVLDPRVRFLDGALAVAKTLDFAAVQNHPTLDRVKNLILMLGLAIVGHHFMRGGARRFRVDRLGIFSLGFWLGGRGRWLSLFLIQGTGYSCGLAVT